MQVDCIEAPPLEELGNRVAILLVNLPTSGFIEPSCGFWHRDQNSFSDRSFTGDDD
jgi:hypothetical protein